VKSNNPSVCLGHGACQKDNPTDSLSVFECRCDFAFSGVNCQASNSLLFAIRYQWYIWFLIVPSALLVICIVVCVIVLCVARKIGKQRSLLAKFDELDDVELLIEEQKVFCIFCFFCFVLTHFHLG